MSIIVAPRIYELINEYSDNLLNYESTFNNDITFTTTSGSGIAQINDSNFFQGGKSLKVINYDNIPMTFGTSTDLGCIIEQTGSHIFSFRLLAESANGDGPSFIINVFRNGIIYHNLTALYNEAVTYNNWMVFAQHLYFESGDVISFNFDFNPAFDNDMIWVDGLKLEFDDRNLGIPTAWSMPKDYCCSDNKGYLKNTHQGWGYYADSLTTPSITIGTTYAQITIDALGALTNTNYLPLEIRGTSNLWSGNKITPISVGDDYDGRFDVTISAKSGSPSYIEVILDISGSTAGTNKVFTGYIQTGNATPYDQSLPLDFFSLTTFLANGGRLYAKVDTGSVTLTRRNIKISRKSKAF